MHRTYGFTQPHTMSVTTEYLFNSIGLSCSKVVTHAWEWKRKNLVTPFWKSFFLWLLVEILVNFWDWSQSSALAIYCNWMQLKVERSKSQIKNKRRRNIPRAFACDLGATWKDLCAEFIVLQARNNTSRMRVWFYHKLVSIDGFYLLFSSNR